jgi:asparagine synthase (glutamine-hydrolysing)
MRRFTSPKYAGLLEYGGDVAGAYLLRRGMFAPWELPDILDPDLVRAGWCDLQTIAKLERTHRALSTDCLKISALEATWYMRNQLLRDTDWASMTHGLEVRVPYIDVALWRTVAPFLAKRRPAGKEIIAGVPTKPLPVAVVERAKTGFSTPVQRWVAEAKAAHRDRGLRGWARRVYAAHLRMS